MVRIPGGVVGLGGKSHKVVLVLATSGEHNALDAPYLAAILRLDEAFHLGKVHAPFIAIGNDSGCTPFRVRGYVSSGVIDAAPGIGQGLQQVHARYDNLFISCHIVLMF